MTVEAESKAPESNPEPQVEGGEKPESTQEETLARQREQDEAQTRADTTTQVEGVKADVELDRATQEGADTDADEAPPTPPEAKTEEEQSFADKVLEAYETQRSGGASWLTASFGALVFAFSKGPGKLWDWISGLFSGKKEKEKPPVQQEGSDPDEDQDTDSDANTSTETVPSSLRQLREALTANPTWKEMAAEAGRKFAIPVHIIFAFARFESGFNPNAVNGEVAGLGQFWGPTWEEFMAENPEFAGAERSDPRASLHAIAWYAHKNAVACGIDPYGPDAAAKLYEAHHNGTQGYRDMEAYRKGKTTPGQKVPGTYLGKQYPKFGVPKVETYTDYVKLITAMSAGVQKVDEIYKKELPEAPRPSSAIA
jgi:hypothetical protein